MILHSKYTIGVEWASQGGHLYYIRVYGTGVGANGSFGLGSHHTSLTMESMAAPTNAESILGARFLNTECGTKAVEFGCLEAE
jgi:hypothetical protein